MTTKTDMPGAGPVAEETVPAILWPYAICFLFLVLLTLWPFLRSCYCVTDDMSNALATYGDFVEGAKAQGRLHFASLHGITAFGAHRIGEAFGGHVLVNALALLSCLANAVCLGYLVRLVSNSFYLGFFACCVWIVTVQDSWSFFPLVISPAIYSLPLSCFLLALAFQEHFLRTGRTHFAWLCSGSYFLSLQYSEMFICLYPVFLLMLARYGRAAFKVRNVLFTLAPVVVFATAFLVFRAAFPSRYEGNTFSGEFSPLRVLSTLFAYVWPSIPTWQFFVKSPICSGHWSSGYIALCNANIPFLLSPQTLAGIPVAVITKALLFSGLAVHLASRVVRHPQFGAITLFLLACSLVVLPNIPFAFNEKYQAWASWLSGYTGTYYSTFGMALLCTLIGCFFARLPKVLSIPVIFLVSFGVVTLTSIHNETMAQTKRQEGLRWDLMDEWTKTPEFRAIEDGAVVYAPSLFTKLNRFALVADNCWSQYIKAKTGRKIGFTRYAEDFLASFDKAPARVYFLKFSADNNLPEAVFLFARVCRVDRLDDLEIPIRVFGDEAQLLFRMPQNRCVLLFEDHTGNHAVEVPAPYVDGKSRFHLKRKDIRLNGVFAVNNSDAFRFEPLSVNFGGGFQGMLEEGVKRWTWSIGDGQDCEVRLVNLSSRPINADVSFELVDWAGDGLIVTVQIGGAQHRYTPPPQGSSLPVVLPVVVPPEGLKVRFYSEPTTAAKNRRGSKCYDRFGIFHLAVHQRSAPHLP